jgi:DNA polymerase III alpha subunit (gram-positive type)
MLYICVDVEASGQLPPMYNLLSIGATAVHSRGNHHVLGESMYVELKPIFDGFDPAAMAVCGLDADRLAREGQEPTAAMQRLTDWSLAQREKSSDRPVFVGHNAVFDWAYISYYYAHCGLDNPFGYKAIDTKSLAMGVLRIPWQETSKERLEAALGLPPLDPARVHRADYDAHYQAQILQTLLDRP